jgi:hypothetical protein
LYKTKKRENKLKPLNLDNSLLSLNKLNLSHKSWESAKKKPKAADLQLL